MTSEQILFLVLWSLPAVMVLGIMVYRLKTQLPTPENFKRTMQMTSICLSAYVLISLWLDPFHAMK
jgi:hypothetical protein